jgi:hypothetical protein
LEKKLERKDARKEGWKKEEASGRHRRKICEEKSMRKQLFWVICGLVIMALIDRTGTLTFPYFEHRKKEKR